MPVEEGSGQGGSALLKDLKRALPFFAAIGPDEIEVEPVSGGLGPEVGGVSKRFAIEEFIFDEAVDGFDITLPGVTLGRDVAMRGTQGADGGGQSLLVLVFEELGAVVSLPDQG